jgi:hypothetical protein
MPKRASATAPVYVAALDEKRLSALHGKQHFRLVAGYCVGDVGGERRDVAPWL